MIPHQLHLDIKQIKALLKGKGITLKHSQMGSDKGKHIIYLKDDTAKKLLSSFKKLKGMRLKMTPEEINHSMEHGTGFFSSMYNKAKHVAHHVAHHAKEHLISTAADTLGHMVSNETGSPELGNILSTSIKMKKGGRLVKGSPEAKAFMASIRKKKGKGLGEDILSGLQGLGDAHNWESGAKLVGRTAIPALLGAAGGMAGSIEGGPLGGFAGSKAGNMVGNEIVNQIGGTLKSQLSNAYDKVPVELHHPLEDLGRAGIDLAGFGLKSKAMEIYEKVPKELHPILEMLAERAEHEIGSGVRRRGRPRKKGGDLASTTEPYKQAMSIKGIVNDNNVINNAPVSKYRINPKVKKNSTEMTLSPYQHASSPAMNPFKPSSYTQLGGTSQGVGSEIGRGLY